MPLMWGRWKACQKNSFKEGGQGRLYYVTDVTKQTDGIYVLKELKNPKRLKRFNSELEAISILDEHPNIVPLIDSGIYRKADNPSYVMPKADMSLEQYLLSKGISPKEKLSLFCSICEGVSHIHDKLIIHRDIKPENILMFGSTPKITDLGLCLISDMPRATETPEAVGSRYYMAPEMEDGKNVDIGYEADLYSLGKVLYWLLSDGKIFSREKFQDKDWRLSKMMHDTRLDIFDEIFRQTIHHNPKERLKNVGELTKLFNKAKTAFLEHPKTTLEDKYGRIQLVLLLPEKTLQTLTPDEWNELFIQSENLNSEIPITVFKAATRSLDEKFTFKFTEIFLKTEGRFDPEFISEASAQILLHVNKKDTLFHLWLDPTRFSHLALNALRQGNDKIANAIAEWSYLTLQHCEEVLSELIKNYNNFRAKARNNFLLSAINSSFVGKEDFFLKLSRNLNTTAQVFEMIVAGLCACTTEPTIVRVFELESKLLNEAQKTAFPKGIAHGCLLGHPSAERLKKLKGHKWKNSVINVLLENIINATENKEESGSLEDGEV